MNILPKLPEDLFAKVMLFHSHPVADLFKIAVQTVNEELYEIIEGDYEYGGEDFCRADEMSFAEYFFFNRREEEKYKRCFDEWMAGRAEMDDEYDDY